MEFSISLSEAERVVVDDVLLVVRAARRASLVHGVRFDFQLHAPSRRGDDLVIPLGALEHVLDVLATATSTTTSGRHAVQAIADRITGHAVTRGWMI